MAGVWKKTLNYLGLVEEDEAFVDEMPEAEPAPRPPDAATGRWPTELGGGRGCRPHDRRAAPACPRPSAIHKSEPKRFNEAREVADRFKERRPPSS